MSSGREWLSEARGEDPTSSMLRGMSAVILSFFGSMAALVATAFDGLAEMVQVFAAARKFLVSLILEPTRILEAGAMISSESLTDFGVFAFVMAVVVIGAAWFMWDKMNVSIPLVDRYLGR